MVSEIGNIGEAIKTMKSTFSTAADVIAAKLAIATAGLTLVLDAIMMCVQAFGLMGDSGTEELTGMGAVIDGLKQKSDQWIDDFSNALLDFLRTGQGGFKELFNSILDDIFTLSVSELLVKPIVGAIGGMFADGAAFSGGNVIPFAGGGIVNQPTMFHMSGGRKGIMGEAGEEAVMPLKRLPGGKLGVSADGIGGGGNVFVTVEDHRKSGSPVRVEEGRRGDGARTLRVVIHDTVRGLIANSELDGDFAQAYGLQRRGI